MGPSNAPQRANVGPKAGGATTSSTVEIEVTKKGVDVMKWTSNAKQGVTVWKRMSVAMASTNAEISLVSGDLFAIQSSYYARICQARCCIGLTGSSSRRQSHRYFADEFDCECGENEFRCDKYLCQSYIKNWCNKRKDCEDGTDEPPGCGMYLIVVSILGN